MAAYTRLSRLGREARRPAVLVAAVDSHADVLEAMTVEAGHSLVIGRHTACGLQLPSDTVSLRHLVAHARSESPGASPAIRLWDLNTHRPFITEDGQPNAAVMAQGLLYAAVGEYALLFVPTLGDSGSPWPARAEEAWSALPPRQFIDRRASNTSRLHHSQHLRQDGRPYQTDVSRTDPPLMLGEGESTETAWATLRLVRERNVEEFRISREHLEQGVLLGRYERCAIPLSALSRISRVHLLLVRMGEDVVAIDTASTNGTRRGRKQIETITLEDLDSLELGTSLQLQWRRLHHGATSVTSY